MKKAGMHLHKAGDADRIVIYYIDIFALEIYPLLHI